MDDSSATNKITSTWNSYAPTLFTQYENIDITKGASKGYSDAKITSYNMSTSGTNTWLSTDQKGNYAYEKYNTDKNSNNPWLKFIYNYYYGVSNRNTSNIGANAGYWLSSRCVDAYWNNANFQLRYVSSNNIIGANYLFSSGNAGFAQYHSIRPVLQVEK